MEKSRAIEILERWNPWTKEIETGISRDYTETLIKFARSGKVLSILGVRRAGKSTIMRQVAGRLSKEEGKENILIINLEDPTLEGIRAQDLQSIYDAFLEVIKPKGKPFVFLDEIQNVPGWERFVRSLNERKEAHIFVSGSSSKLLSEELATSLAGRQLKFEIFPLSFKEFLRFNDMEVESSKDMLLNAKKIKALFREYMEFGGYPEVVLNKDREFRMRTLMSYYEDILLRDVVMRFKVKEVEKLRALARFYLTNISNPITFNSIAKFLDLPTETIRRFTNYLESTRMLFFIKRFSYKVKEQEKAPRKVYAIDVGLPNVLGFKFSTDAGRVAENLVAIALKRAAEINPCLETYYWSDGQREVDFVIKERTRAMQLIQVCWDVSNPTSKAREIDAAIRASKKLRCPTINILTEDYEAKEKHSGKTIAFIPLWKWLLSSQPHRL